jgi:hypothetical protein
VIRQSVVAIFKQARICGVVGMAMALPILALPIVNVSASAPLSCQGVRASSPGR